MGTTQCQGLPVRALTNGRRLITPTWYAQHIFAVSGLPTCCTETENNESSSTATVSAQHTASFRRRTDHGPTMAAVIHRLCHSSFVTEGNKNTR